MRGRGRVKGERPKQRHDKPLRLTDTISIQADNFGTGGIRFEDDLVVIRIFGVKRPLLPRLELHESADVGVEVGAAR